MDKALKQRMVGASVIIALVVIVLPMLLSGRTENGAQQSQKIELPPRPEALTFETRRFPVDEAQPRPETAGTQVETAPLVAPVQRAASTTAASTETSTATSAPTPTPGPEQPETVSRQDESAPEPETVPDDDLVEDTAGADPAASDPVEPAEQPIDASSEPVAVPVSPPASAGRYLVQVASLGSAENATRLMTNLQQQGYPVLLDTVESGVGTLNRVRVGPYQKEEEAAVVVGKIDEAFSDLNPKLIDLQPEAATAASESPDALARWAVQAGSFSEAANADRLVVQLRGDGMDAYQEKVTSGASVVYRVRIGPFLERESALAARQALSAKRSIDGVVVNAD